MQQIASPPAAPFAPGLGEAIQAAGYTITVDQVGWWTEDAAAVQQLIDGYAGSAAELGYWQEQKAAEIAAQYAARIAAGRSYTVPNDASGAHNYQIDEVPTATRQSSQQAIGAVAQQADRALRNGVTGTPWDPAVTIAFFFVDASNQHVPMTPQQAYDWATAIGQYCTSLKLRALQLAAQVAAATTAAAVQAVDVTTGWPSNT